MALTIKNQAAPVADDKLYGYWIDPQGHAHPVEYQHHTDVLDHMTGAHRIALLLLNCGSESPCL